MTLEAVLDRIRRELMEKEYQKISKESFWQTNSESPEVESQKFWSTSPVRMAQIEKPRYNYREPFDLTRLLVPIGVIDCP
jgi:hypothetical protein